MCRGCGRTTLPDCSGASPTAACPPARPRAVRAKRACTASSRRRWRRQRRARTRTSSLISSRRTNSAVRPLDAAMPRDFSLIVPTYNRCAHLARLLRFLARQKAAFPVLVLDSGAPESRQRNRELAAASGLDVRYAEFDEATPPFEKFWRGAQRVETQFASFCADDDLVLVGALDAIVPHLAARPHCAVAHGWYFT